MECDEFEWDDQNADEHFAKHGVSFDSAKAVFRDPFAIEYEDRRERYREPRYIIIGMAYERLLFVVFTPVGNRMRIISAREVEAHERRQYHEENRGYL
ncbi:MAG: BrnT family toxin [Rhodomicrobium sp.]